ncbi:hypothetical protein LTR08_003356 [Meristemomyces frigidus]|nr:hypothetical protein LTR08_003356 [Meristemomyces frigidus]
MDAEAQAAADTAQMLADLGLDRRDMISAPLADGKGRPMQEDPRRQQAVQADAEARRARTVASSSAGGDRGARLLAWNTDTTFEADSVTSQLTDRFSGQGHRRDLEEMQAARSGRQPRGQWEHTENRFGEERTMYLQERAAANGSNYVATSAPRQGPPQGRNNAFDGGTVPRSMPDGNTGHHQSERGRVAAPSNPNRAPSPRSQGTTRFLNGLRVNTLPGTARAGSTPPTTSATTRPPPRTSAAMRPPTTSAAMRPPATTSAAVRPTPTTSTATRPPPSAPAAMRQPPITQNGMRPPPTPAAATIPPQANAAAQRRPGSSQSHGAARPASAASNSNSSVTTSTQPTLNPEVVEMKNRALAEYYAANPGPERDAYLLEYPDRERYMVPALNRLIKEAFIHARDQYGRDAEVHLQIHRDREWLLLAASKAKDLVENGSAAQADAYYAAHPDRKVFRKPAEFYFKSKPPVSGVQATPSPAAPAVQQSRSASQSDIGARVAQNTEHVADVEEDEVSTPQSPSVRSDETTATELPQTASGTGTISTTFYDDQGRRQEIHDVDLDIPVQVHVSITSRSGDFDARDLLPQIDALVQSMQARSNGRLRPHARQTWNGLWEEEEDL